jgi:ketosteroid isomerase-like protein
VNQALTRGPRVWQGRAVAGEQNIETVKGLWRAFSRGGLDSVLTIVDEEVEWIPFGGGGNTFRGHEGLRRYMHEREERQGDVTAEPFGYGDYGESVIVYGHVVHGEEDQRVFWVYSFHGGKLCRFEAFTDQDAAFAAARATA